MTIIDRRLLHFILVTAASCVPATTEEPAVSRPAASPRDAKPEPRGAKAEPPTHPAECEVDADCVPSSCCASPTCGPIAKAPDCTGAACPDVCSPHIDNVKCGGRCVCDNGRCGAILPPKGDPPPKFPPR